jgi:hypothetical protein
MNYVCHSLRLARIWFERAFLLIFPCLTVAIAPIHAQTEKNDSSSCTRAINAKGGEVTLIARAAEDCPARNAEAPSTTDAATPVAPAAPAPAPIVTPATPSQQQIAPVNHRLFGVLANYTTVETEDRYGTLSAATKFKLSVKTMTDPVTVSFLAGVALLGQARDSDPSYGQGFSGYDKRFATFYADTGIGTLMTTSVFPTVLHQDPRYFQLGQGGFRRRFLHAAASIFVAHADDGAVQFNYSQIAGNAVAAGISNAYRPESQRTLGTTFTVWGTDTLLNMGCNVAKEFWPDLRRKLHKPAAD